MPTVPAHTAINHMTVAPPLTLQTTRGQISYSEAGDGAMVVLLHGMLGTADEVWARHIPRLSERYRVLAPDLPLHGRSTSKLPRLDWAAWVDDMTEFIQVLSTEPVLLCGHSAGANTGLDIAMRHPSLFRALALNGTTIKVDSQMMEGLQAYLGVAEIRSPSDIDEVDKQRPQLAESLRSKHGDNWRELLYKSWPLLIWAPEYSAEDYRRITAPVLVTVGDRDPFLDLGQTNELHHLVPKSELAVIPGTGHSFTPLTMTVALDFFERN
jgi:pimeloyl-ACP methyl ester carboxylesterase